MDNAPRRLVSLMLCGLWAAGAAGAEAAGWFDTVPASAIFEAGSTAGVVSLAARAAGDRQEVFQVAPRKQRQDLARREKRKKKKASDETEGKREGAGGDPNLSLTLPPRTINDVISVLDRHRAETAAVKKARDLADQAPPAGKDPTKLAKFYFIRGMAAEELGRARQQLDDLRLATRYARDSVSADRVKILFRLALAEFYGGKASEAIARLQEAIPLVRVDRQGSYFKLYRIMAVVHAGAGDLEEAQAFLEKLEKVHAESSAWRSLRNRPDKRALFSAHVNVARARVAQTAGRHRDAEAFFRAAIAALSGHKRWRDGDYYEYVIRNLADNLRMQGRLSEAEIEARKAVLGAVAKKGRNSGRTAGALNYLTSVLIDQGRLQEAERLAETTVDILKSTGASEANLFLAFARRLMAGARAANGRWDEAEAVFETMRRGLEGDREIFEMYLRGNADWGFALIKTGWAAEAITLLEPVYDRRRQQLGDKHHKTALLAGVLASALAKTGDRARALRLFGRAVPILLSRSRASEGQDSSKATRDRHLRLILEGYIELLQQIQGSAVAAEARIDAAAESFRLADVARSRAVQRALTQSGARAAARDPELAALVREEQDARRQIGALYALLAGVLGQPPADRIPGVEDGLRQRIDALRDRRAVLAERIEAEFPTYANLIDPKPATLQEARASLRRGEVLLAFYSGPERVYVWVVPAAGRPSFHAAAIGRAELLAMVRALRQALDPRPRTLGDIPAYDLKTAYRLYEALLAPAAATWKLANNLVVVAHGPLGLLPLSVLLTAPGELGAETGPLFSKYRKLPWLARSHAVTLVPSVTSLTALRRLPPGDPARRPFVGFGDPLFSAAQAADAKAAASVAAVTTRGMPIALRSAPSTREVDSADLALLPRLPDTADELRSIAVALNADPTRDVFLGRKANEKMVKTLDLFGYKVLAFATHGLVPGDLNGLTQPALALSAPDVAKVDGDGLLTMGEILGLKLNADWAVLSACNTGAAAGAGAEAVSGLGRAFFYAGTRALLVSNWPVHSDAARALTTDTFRRQAADPGLDRAEALRRAMLGLMDDGGFKDTSGRMLYSYAHPLFWAPFSIVGDGGR
ncbi:MAG: CHAT domain-containing protein [Kiloniellales bacterium]